MALRASITFLCALATSVVANGISATCQDNNTVKVAINYNRTSQILAAQYGSCNLTTGGINGEISESSRGWTMTLEPRLCDMGSYLQDLSYGHEAFFYVGTIDQGVELTTTIFKIDTYCNYTTTYLVSFSYGAEQDYYKFGESAGLLNIDFLMRSYNPNFTELAESSSFAGDMIHLGLEINSRTFVDFHHALGWDANEGKVFVPKSCGVTDGALSYTYFDSTGDAKCSNGAIDLALGYQGGANQMWKISHRLFLLNSLESANYNLSCEVLVCDAQRIGVCDDHRACLIPPGPCDAGTFGTAPWRNCTKCPAGTAQPLTGQSDCNICPAGTYATEGSSDCTDCPANFYSAAGAGFCMTCPFGNTSFGGSSSCNITGESNDHEGYLFHHPEIDGGCWSLVRRTHSSSWHLATDLLLGSQTYGTFHDNITGPGQYSRRWDHYDIDDLLFSTGDGSKYLALAKTVLHNGCTGHPGCYVKAITSSEKAEPHTVRFYRDTIRAYPFISLIPCSHPECIFQTHKTELTDSLIYLGAGINAAEYVNLLQSHQGANVFIRKRPDSPGVCSH